MIGSVERDRARSSEIAADSPAISRRHSESRTMHSTAIATILDLQRSNVR